MGSITINDGSSLNQEQPLDIVNRINGLGARVQTAIFAERFVEARKLALMMLTAISIIPDGEKQGEAGAKLSWDRMAIQGLITQIAELEGQCRTLGIQTTSLQYSNRSGCDKYHDIDPEPSERASRNGCGGGCGC